MTTYQAAHRRRKTAGYSLAELLAVLALASIVLAIGIPLVNEQIRIAEVRGAADLMGVHLRAARMIAISHHKDITMTISVDPANTYAYEGTDGRTRTITMPGRVRIASGSSASIVFHSDGSVGAARTVTVESDVSGATERWTLSVNTIGLLSTTRTRVG